MNRISGILLTLILAFTLSCSPDDDTPATAEKVKGVRDTEILIGSSVPLTGGASFLGTQITYGAQAYFNKVNESGGIHGRKIKLITQDDRYNPARCKETTIKLITEDQVFMLFNYVGTPTAKVSLPLVNKHEIPIMGLFTGAEFLRNPFQPNVINVRASYFEEVIAMVDSWVKKGKKNIAVYMQDDAFGEAVLLGAELALARHKLNIGITVKFQRGKLPTDEAIEEIVAASPEAVIMVGTYTPLAHFVKMAKEAGLKDIDYYTVSFVGSEAFAKEILAFNGGYEKNVYVTQVVPSPTDAANKASIEFRELFAKYYPNETPNYVAMEGYINAKILTEILRRMGKNISHDRFIAIAERMRDYNAGTGFRVVMRPTRHSFFEDVVISTITNGKFEAVKK